MSWPAAAPERSDPRSRLVHPGVLALVLLTGLLGGILGALGVGLLNSDTDGPEVTDAASPVFTAEGSAGSVSAIAQAALPSVVLISVGEDSTGGVGSGFVIDEDGYIVTNQHVVQAALDADQSVTVDFMGGSALSAEIVGGDSAYDIAVLKVEREGLKALRFADSEQVQIGIPVVAVGAPLGLEATVTSGIVSALDRPVVAGDIESASYINAVQTDAAINPGNSGGPLLDLSGRVIGVNSAIAQLPGQGTLTQSGSIGLGFAIPADQVSRTATSLIETGESDYPVMGVLVDLAYTGQGARVLTETADGDEPVTPGGPAELAGVRPGDIILAIDEERINDGSDLIVRLRSREIGDQVDLLLRDADGEERTVSVTLQGSK
ncbi:MAG: trypsin-like peptidase domain-containing protein [Ornithinimicrobium sp.]